MEHEGEGRVVDGREFPQGEVIKLYGVYRCGCGEHEIFGVSGRRFPRQPCAAAGVWTMVHRAREETFF